MSNKALIHFSNFWTLLMGIHRYLLKIDTHSCIEIWKEIFPNDRMNDINWSWERKINKYEKVKKAII